MGSGSAAGVTTERAGEEKKKRFPRSLKGERQTQVQIGQLYRGT